MPPWQTLSGVWTSRSGGKLLHINCRRHKLRALPSRAPPHFGDPIALSHWATDLLDVVLTEPGNYANSSIATRPMPSLNVVHSSLPDDEGPVITVKLILNYVKFVLCHWTLLHRITVNGATKRAKNSLLFDRMGTLLQAEL
jgi:hypothetical protein